MTLDKVGITIVLYRLARSKHERARDLYGKLMGSWGHRPDRQRVTVKLGEPDIQCLEGLRLNGFLTREPISVPYYVVKYQHPKKKELEVIVRTKKKPQRKRTFKMAGAKGVLVAVAVRKVQSTHKEAVRMATKTKRGKKAVEEDELEDLEGLEDLEDLEDEDLEEDEPEDEEEDEEDEEPAPKRRGKAKPAAKSKATTKRKRKVVEEDDEDDDEEEEPAPKRASKTKGKATAAKGKTAKSNGKASNLPATRELPKGKLGPQDIADMVGGDCDARYVRVWLRDSDYERDEGSRWAFSKTDARQIAKEIKRDRKG